MGIFNVQKKKKESFRFSKLNYDKSRDRRPGKGETEKKKRKNIIKKPLENGRRERPHREQPRIGLVSTAVLFTDP